MPSSLPAMVPSSASTEIPLLWASVTRWRVMARFSLNGRCEPSNIMELKPAAIAASQASREVP